MRNILAIVSVLVVTAGCTESAEFGAERVALRGLQYNQVRLQGPGLVLQGPGLVLQGPGLVLQGPGLVLQGPGLVLQGPGLVLQGVAFNGPGLVLQGPGLVLQGPGLVLQGTSFSGVFVKDGVEYEVGGTDFIGAEMSLRLTAVVAGEPIVEDVVLRINNITQSPIDADINLYDLSYRSASSGEWLPYCGSPGVTAIPLSHYWDHQTGDRVDNDGVVTFACTNAVLAKCALWGYRPWDTAVSCEGKKKKQVCTEISLQDHHQACTRMARADYCGDGHPSTVDGTLIDIWDDLEDPRQTPFTDWPVEAEWGPDGATCVNFTRHPELGHPACFTKPNGKPVKSKKCDGKLDGESLLGTAFSPDPL